MVEGEEGLQAHHHMLNQCHNAFHGSLEKHIEETSTYPTPATSRTTAASIAEASATITPWEIEGVFARIFG
jgi:hypothetical protein